VTTFLWRGSAKHVSCRRYLHSIRAFRMFPKYAIDMRVAGGKRNPFAASGAPPVSWGRVDPSAPPSSSAPAWPVASVARSALPAFQAAQPPPQYTTVSPLQAMAVPLFAGYQAGGGSGGGGGGGGGGSSSGAWAAYCARAEVPPQIQVRRLRLKCGRMSLFEEQERVTAH
jgi:hypothetical protein